MSAARTTVLLTGGSSFTGVWIAEALAEAGFRVVAPLLRPREAYAGVRRDRIARLEQCARVTFDRPFGSERFLDEFRASGGVEVLAHHAAHITGYREPGFDPLDALARNTAGISPVLATLRDSGGRLVILTGSVFEAGEGGDEATSAVTPYGLSKTLTREATSYWTADAGLAFARFVIPSPYGPLEEPRFGWRMFSDWFAGVTPTVRTPRYIRDHLTAADLAAAYVAHVVRSLESDWAGFVARPSGWIASQGDFARHLAAEASQRLGRSCPLVLAEQPMLDEPLVRINDGVPPGAPQGAAAFWDDYVGWYETLHREGRLSPL
jgi:UDP-glucose 4-epimerase